MTPGRLKLSNISIKRSGRVIINIDNLEISAGEFVAVLGTNGAGKTTLLKCCCGLVKPDSGSVLFDDIDLAGLSRWQKTNFRKQIGYIPQSADYNSDLPFTVREVAAMGRASTKPLFCRLDKNDYEFVDSWIDKLGLSRLANQTFRTLSGGERQKALIARAMAQEPEILMLDEPGKNLDFNAKRQFITFLDDLYEQNPLTILMVSHQMEMFCENCKRSLLMDKGRILADGQQKDILKTEAFQALYNMENIE